MKKLIIIGNGQLAKTLFYNLKRDAYYPTYFSIDKKYIKQTKIFGIPVIPFDTILKMDPHSICAIVAIAHTKMNTIRQIYINTLKQNNIELINYISPKANISNLKIIGKNNIIMDEVFIGPYSSINTGNVFWPKCCISHDSHITNFITITSGVMSGGNVVIHNNSFIGLNATIQENIKIEKFSLIGAGSIITNNIISYSVIVPERSIKLKKNSNNFFN